MPKTLSGSRIRYFGPTKVLYHLKDESPRKRDADSLASAIRHKGYGARVTHEGKMYQVWESRYILK